MLCSKVFGFIRSSLAGLVWCKMIQGWNLSDSVNSNWEFSFRWKKQWVNQEKKHCSFTKLVQQRETLIQSFEVTFVTKTCTASKGGKHLVTNHCNVMFLHTLLFKCSTPIIGDHKVGRYGRRGLNVLHQRWSTAAASEGLGCVRSGCWGGNRGRRGGRTTTGEHFSKTQTLKSHTFAFTYVQLCFFVYHSILTVFLSFLISSRGEQAPWAPCQVQTTPSTWNIRAEAAKPQPQARVSIRFSSASESRKTDTKRLLLQGERIKWRSYNVYWVQLVCRTVSGDLRKLDITWS